MSEKERKRRRLKPDACEAAAVACCVVNNVGSFWPGVALACCWELNSLGWLTVERESFRGGPVACGVDVVPE